jgi:inner membrane protein
MDNLTHTMLGVALARAGLAQRFGRGTTLVLAIASNLPDVDGLWVMAGYGDSHLSRRMLTHSIPGLLVLGAVAATVFRWLYRNQSWRALFGLCLLGMTVHVFFDLVNSYGVVVLYPFSRTRFELAWIFIIDLVLLGLLLAPAGLGPLLKRRLNPRRLWQASLIGVALYVAGCGVARWQAERVFEGHLSEQRLESEMTYVFPEPLGPHRWRGVRKDRDGGSQVYLIQLRSREAVLHAEFQTHELDPAVRLARTSDKGRKLEWFFQAPVWELLGEDGAVTSTPHAGNGRYVMAYDLRFYSLVIDRGIPFRYEFRIEDGWAEPLGWR